MTNCVPLCGPLPAGKVLREKEKVQGGPTVTVPLATLPPESKVTGPTLVPPKLPKSRVNACPCGNSSTAARFGPAPFANVKERSFRSLAVAEEVDPLLPLQPRTMSVPMTSTRAIHCAIRRGRAICETVRGHVISSSFMHCASWCPALPYNPPATMSKRGNRYDQTLRRREGQHRRDGTVRKAKHLGCRVRCSA